jgi:penicillin-binding protein 1C
MSAYAAWIIADILSDRASRCVGFGPAPTLITPFESMFKTGTANQFQHIWALGATKRYTVGVWMGNFSGETVVGRTGSSIPARIASRLLSALEQSAGNAESGNLAGPLPQGTRELQICSLSGMTIGPYCTGRTKELLLKEIKPVCSWHSAMGLFYPDEYQAWLSERFRSGSTRQEGAGRIRIPASGSVYYIDPSIPIEAQALRIETTGFSPEARLYSDGVLMGNLNHAGVYALQLSRGLHSVVVEEALGAYASASFEVR